MEGSQTHQMSGIYARGRKLGERGFAHGGEGSAETALFFARAYG